ncbi:MAG: hypothetical protein PHH36_12410 [Sideroxydans sp.]|nr:hypothetical protein [Sideroxydans sp.]
MKITRTKMGALAASVLVAGCAGMGEPAIGPTGAPRGGTCDAGPAQSAVGHNSTASVVEAARVRSGVSSFSVQ